VTSRTVAHQILLSRGFSRQEYWRGLPCPPPGHLPDPGIEPGSPTLQADSLLLSHWGSPLIVNKKYKIFTVKYFSAYWISCPSSYQAACEQNRIQMTALIFKPDYIFKCRLYFH